MSIRKSVILFSVALSITAFMSGCSSSTKEGGSPADVQKVGDSACFQCHAATADPLTGETFITQYARSLHAELGCESCHGGGAMHNGVGPLPYTLNSEVSDAQKAARCAQCHDGVTQITALNGDLVTAPLSSSPNFSNGNHANPFGAEEAKEAKCARCHSHEGSILYGKDGFTGDKSIMDNTAFQPVLARDPETFNTIKCATCHEHGGNLRQSKTRDLAGNIVTWDPNANRVIDQFDLCTSCHTMNTNIGKLIGSGNVLKVYTSAALPSGATGFKNISTAGFYHNTSWYRVLPSTHYDQPASRTTASGTTIEGYVVRTKSLNAAGDLVTHKNPCFDCHGHEFKTNTRALANRPERGATTFTDWAQSAHAGKLLKLKAAAAALPSSSAAEVDDVMSAGVKDTTAKASAWGHYNWDNSTGNSSSSPDPDRKSCQRCHTSTGASNFMKNPGGYDASKNNFSHLIGPSLRTPWGTDPATGRLSTTATYKTSPQNELLYCWGCHSNAGTGKLYTPGARTEVYAAVVSTTTGTAGTTVTISYPDIAGSNVCMTCHVGREVGENIKTITDANGVLSFVNSHYLAAGAQLFGQSGYTFTGRDYTAPAFFAHDKIGTAAAPGTGSNGPCIGCHMTSPNKHKFTNLSSSGGVVTAITSPLCAVCHTGSSALTPASLTEEEEEYDAALAALNAALASKGIHFFSGAYPYFFTAAYVAGGSNTGFTNWAGVYGLDLWKDVMGAAFNSNLLAHDPGGFAHNRYYVKRLVWDSIDFITNGILDHDVVASIEAQATAGRITAAQSAAAKTYLGTTRP